MLFSIKDIQKKYHTKKDTENLVLDLEKHRDEITEIDFTSNVFTLEALIEVEKVIKTMNNLKVVILDEVFTTLTRDEMMKCFVLFCNALKGKPITHLDLSNNAISCNFPTEFVELIESMSNLVSLKMRNCGIGLQGGDKLGECFLKFESKHCLEYLDVAQNRFFSFPEKLSEGIAELKNLCVLRLEYNTIEKISMAKFLVSMVDHPLEELNVTDNFLNLEGCRALGDIFASWNIRELRMGDCLARNEGIFEFVKSANKKVVPLRLPGDFDSSPDLILDVSYNDWEQVCVDDLSKLCVKYSISKIYINGNLYDEDEALYDAVRSYGGKVVSSTIDAENEDSNNIDDTVIEMIGKL